MRETSKLIVLWTGHSTSMAVLVKIVKVKFRALHHILPDYHKQEISYCDQHMISAYMLRSRASEVAITGYL